MAPHERATGEGEVEPEVDVNAIVVAQVETNMKGKTGKETRDSICTLVHQTGGGLSVKSILTSSKLVGWCN